MPLGMEVGLGPGHIVLDGHPSPHRKGQSSPHFSADVYCGQTAGWIKMPLGTEISLGPGHIVFDGIQFPLPLRKGHRRPHFSVDVYCGQTAGWIYQDTTGYAGRPWTRRRWVS